MCVCTVCKEVRIVAHLLLFTLLSDHVCGVFTLVQKGKAAPQSSSGQTTVEIDPQMNG
ncbi:hypothetical protein ACQJBY_055388 [Aegilops geniculata]